MNKGPIGSLLFGEGRQALLHPIISSTGAVDSRLLEAVHPPGPRGNLLARAAKGLKHTLVGDHALDVLKQRFQQGGVLGKGGVLHGAAALHPEMVEAYNAQPSAAEGLKEILRKHKMNASSGLINAAFLTGIPSYAGYRALERGDPGEAGRILGDTLGYAVLAPAGLAAMGGSMLGSRLGKLVGERFKQPELPSIPEPYAPGVPTLADYEKVSNALGATAPKVTPVNLQPAPSPVKPSVFAISPMQPGGNANPNTTIGQPQMPKPMSTTP